MKRIFKISIAGMLTCVLMITSMLCAFAAPASTVNGVDAPVGSTVDYTLYLESYKQDVVGIQMIFKFDTNHLELKNVDLKNFPSATVNANNQGDGVIYFNHSDINGQSFKEAKEVAKLTFTVTKEGQSNIEYLIQYLYDIDLVNIYDYTLTYSLSVDNNVAIATETPILADADKVDAAVEGEFDKGDFANNVEGTGSGIKPTEAPKKPAQQSGNSSDNDNDGNGGNTALFVIGGVVVLALVAVVIIAVAKKKKED